MTFTRRQFIGGSAAAALTTGAFSSRIGWAQPADTIRIGVITDMSGIYRDVQGPTSVTCVQQAVEEFMSANPGIKVEILTADHQNKPDVALAIIREWFDRGGVDVITDVGNSAIALGARSIVESLDKVSIVTSAGSSELTGHSCSANMLHWSWDSWCLAHTTATSTVKTGGDKWFFLTADYAFGHAAQADATKFVEASGGTVIGAVRHPINTSDFSSYLLTAQASGANVVAFANSGSDLITAVKQAQEFGIADSGMKLTAMVGYITDVIGMGLPVAQGLMLTETFYWDLNDRTRDFTSRIRPKLPASVFPNMSHVGNYSGVLHYLKAVREMGVTQARASGRATIEQMKRMPTDDDVFGPGSIRADGRKLHPAYLFEVKAPEESKGDGDIYKLVSTTPAEEAFRPLNEGSCTLIRT
jgi:branched-chain amino acid transport system substrate-binding protein